MAAASGLLGGYQVGLISASLQAKGQRKEKNKDKKTNELSFTSTNFQPNFVAVEKKPLKKSSREKSEETEHSDNEEKKATKRRRRSTEQDDDLVSKTKKQRKTPVKKSADDDPERLTRTIFVGNLPITTTRKELKKLFKKYGAIESTRLRSATVADFQTPKKLAVIKKQFNPNRNNINGYVVFKDKESAENALKSDGELVGDLHIRIDRVGNEGKQYDHKRSIFVGNLNFDIKENDVSNLFAPCGDVQTVRIIRDSATGIGKGFGYVLFKEASSVSLALRMNKSELCGRKVRVQPSQENPKAATGNKFSGVQAKKKFYQKRRVQSQQKKTSGLPRTKKSSLKNKKQNKQTRAKNKK